MRIMDAIDDYKEWNEALWNYFFPQGEPNANPLLNLDEFLVKKIGSEANIKITENGYANDFLTKCLLPGERFENFCDNWIKKTGNGDRAVPKCKNWDRLVEILIKKRLYYYNDYGIVRCSLPAYFGMLCAIMYLACTTSANHTEMKNRAKDYLGYDYKGDVGELVDDLFSQLHRDRPSFDNKRRVYVLGKQEQRNMRWIKYHTILSYHQKRDFIDFIEMNGLEWRDEPYYEFANNTLIPALERGGKDHFIDLVAGTSRRYGASSKAFIKSFFRNTSFNYDRIKSEFDNIAQVKDIWWEYVLKFDYDGDAHFHIYIEDEIPCSISYVNGEFQTDNNSIRDHYIAENVTPAPNAFNEKEFEYNTKRYCLKNINRNRNRKNIIYFQQIRPNTFIQVTKLSPGNNYLKLVSRGARNSDNNNWERFEQFDQIGQYQVYRSISIPQTELEYNQDRYTDTRCVMNAGRWYALNLKEGEQLFWLPDDVQNTGPVRIQTSVNNNGRHFFRLPLFENEESNIRGRLFITDNQNACDNIDELYDRAIDDPESVSVKIRWDGKNNIYQINGWGNPVNVEQVIDRQENIGEPRGHFILTSGIGNQATPYADMLLQILFDLANEEGCISERDITYAVKFVFEFYDIKYSDEARNNLLRAMRLLGYIIYNYDQHLNQMVSPYLEYSNYSINGRNGGCWSNAFLVKGIYRSEDLDRLIISPETRMVKYKRPYRVNSDIETSFPEYKCLPDLILVETDNIDNWQIRPPVLDSYIDGMGDMLHFEELFLNGGDRISNDFIEGLPKVENGVLYENDAILGVCKYRNYNENGIAKRIPMDLMKLYCQNAFSKSICLRLYNANNSLIEHLFFTTDMGLPELMRIALADENLGLPQKKEIFIIERNNILGSVNKRYPLTEIYEYNSRPNDAVILNALSKMAGEQIVDWEESNRALSLIENRRNERRPNGHLYHTVRYKLGKSVNDFGWSTFYYYSVDQDGKKELTAFSFSERRDRTNLTKLCLRTSDGEWIVPEGNDLNELLSRVINNDDLVMNSRQYNGDIPKLPNNIQEINIYKQFNK